MSAKFLFQKVALYVVKGYCIWFLLKDLNVARINWQMINTYIYAHIFLYCLETTKKHQAPTQMSTITYAVKPVASNSF